MKGKFTLTFKLKIFNYIFTISMLKKFFNILIVGIIMFFMLECSLRILLSFLTVQKWLLDV